MTGLAAMKRIRSIARNGILGALTILIAACGTAAERPAAPRVNEQTNALIAGTRAEPEITLSWQAGLLSSSQELRSQIDGFNRLYGLNLKINFRPGPSMREATARTIQEFRDGVKASTDVVLGTEADIGELASAGALMPDAWATWAPNIRNFRLVAIGGVAVQVQTRMPGITYNSSKLTGTAIPHSLADLLKPQYKGRIVTTRSASTFERLGGSEVWGAERTISYVRALAEQVGSFIDCGEEDRVATGEFDVFAYDCGSARVNQMKANGTLIGWSAPTDGALLGYLYMGVPKNAAHPNAAKLWINYMLGREAQDLMFEYEFADHHLVGGSRTFSEVDRMTKSGVRFYGLTVEAAQVDTAKGWKPIGPQLQSILREAVGSRR